MRIVREYSWVLILVAWGLGIGGLQRLSAQESDLPQAVKNALARYSELKTFSMTWTAQYQFGALARARLDSSKLESLSLDETCYLVWQNGKMYKRWETKQERKGSITTHRYEFAFDGRVLAGGSPIQTSNGRLRKASLSIRLAEDEDPDLDYCGVEEIQHLGIHLPRGSGELLRSKQLTSQLFFLLEHNARIKTVGVSEIDGSPMMRVVVKETTPSKLEQVIYLDPKIGYAIRRSQQFTENGQLKCQCECYEHEKLTGPDIHLPRKCRIDYYFSGFCPGEIFETPFRTVTMIVSEYGARSVPDDQFILKYTTPGTRVTDRSLPESKLGHGPVTYTVPANLQDLDRVIGEARSLIIARPEWEKQRKTWRIFLITLNTVALAVLVVFLLIRYRRKQTKS